MSDIMHTIFLALAVADAFIIGLLAGIVITYNIIYKKSISVLLEMLSSRCGQVLTLVEKQVGKRGEE